MDPVHPELDDATVQLVLQLLAGYEERVRRLLAVGMDAGVYADAAGQFDDLRLQVAALCDARFAWIEVLISRFEFTGALWDAHGSADDVRKLQGLAQKHLLALDRFRAQCAPGA